MKIGYCRVSSREQAYNSQALEQQKSRILAQAPDKLFIDVDSGRKINRIGYSSLIDEIKKNNSSKIIITRLDRISRNLRQLLDFLDICQNYKCTIISLDQNIDTATASGKLQINFLASLAEHESEQLRERVIHGHAHHKKKKLGYKAPFGFTKSSDHKFHLDIEPILCNLENKKEWNCAELAKIYINSYLNNKSLHQVIRDFDNKFGIIRFKKMPLCRLNIGLGTASALRHWLLNPILAGNIAYGRQRQKIFNIAETEIIYNTHPDQILLTEDTQERIREIMHHNKKIRGYGNKANHQSHYFAGLIFCEKCHAAATSIFSKGKKINGIHIKKIYYQCSNYKLGLCDQKKSIKESNLQEYFAVEIIKKAKEITNSIQFNQLENNSNYSELNNQLKSLLAIRNPNYAIQDAITDLKKQIEQAKIASNIASKKISDNRDFLLFSFSKKDFWHNHLKENINPSELKDIYRRFINQIFISDGIIKSIDFKI